MSSIFVISNKGYIADLGAGNIECNITAVEEHIPIFIRGGNAVELDTSEGAQIHCPSEAQEQPDPAWLPNLTILSQVSANSPCHCFNTLPVAIRCSRPFPQMVLQKQQGQDGRLEAVMLFEPNATVSRMDRIGEAITRMVSVAATEMYASLYDQLSNSSAIAQYAMQDFELSTPRLTLGNNTWVSHFTKSPNSCKRACLSATLLTPLPLHLAPDQYLIHRTKDFAALPDCTLVLHDTGRCWLVLLRSQQSSNLAIQPYRRKLSPCRDPVCLSLRWILVHRMLQWLQLV